MKGFATDRFKGKGIYLLNVKLKLNTSINFESRWLTFNGNEIIPSKEIKWKLKQKTTTMYEIIFTAKQPLVNLIVLIWPQQHTYTLQQNVIQHNVNIHDNTTRWLSEVEGMSCILCICHRSIVRLHAIQAISKATVKKSHTWHLKNQTKLIVIRRRRQYTVMFIGRRVMIMTHKISFCVELFISFYFIKCCWFATLIIK